MTEAEWKDLEHRMALHCRIMDRKRIKEMSDTPRTDAACAASVNLDGMHACYNRMVDHARVLERELAEAKRASDAMHVDLHEHDEKRQWAEREVARLSRELSECTQSPPLVEYMDRLFDSGNEIPVTKPWLSAETWAVVKDFLRHGLPLDHGRIEIERIYRQRTEAGLRAYSPLAAALEARK